MAKREYAEKFKDPRWQKLRLKILERDGWACQACGDDQSTLHIHHRYYMANTEPWDYPEESLVVLCESCHEDERASREVCEHNVLFALKRRFLCGEVGVIATAFRNMPMLHAPEVVATVIKWALTTPSVQHELIDKYFESLVDKNEEERR